MPPRGRPGAAIALTVHPRTGVHFDEKGFPIFGPHAEAKIDFSWADWDTYGYDGLMREASRRTWRKIKRGEIDGARLGPKQLAALERGDRTIPGFIWHHDVTTGQMQLVDADKHIGTGHLGWAVRGGLEWKM